MGAQGDSGHAFELETLAATHAICRLGPESEAPEWARREPGALLSVTRTEEELSIVCGESLPPPGVEVSRGWRAIRVVGTLGFSLYGVLVSLAAPLADAAIPIFAISSFNTDYVLIPENAFERALEVLSSAGHSPS